MTYTVGHYLFDRLVDVGVDRVFGVPGDFNLTFLDTIVSHDKLQWIGNTNELNAAYAADGYGRINGISAMVTTFGVGELSTVNGVAGSYAERVPVVAITGGPTSVVEHAGKYVHHTLGEGDFKDFQKMFEPITVAQTRLTQVNAKEEIDRVIRLAIMEQRPVHIHLPVDVAAKEVEEGLLEFDVTEKNITSEHKQWLSELKETIDNSKQPVILTGHEINSFKLHDELKAFVEATNIPIAQLSLGKGAIDETIDQYIGMYAGAISEDDVRNYVDSSDCIINIGAKLTDSATAGFSQKFDAKDMQIINHRNTDILNYHDEDIALSVWLKELQDLGINKRNDEYKSYQHQYDVLVDEVTGNELTQKSLHSLMNQYLEPNDILLAEQGTSFFGAYEMHLPSKVSYIGQPLWGSIGYTLPALLGTQMADLDRRNILMIGDGSLQLTVQSISTMIREGIKPIIFVVNNDGYTVERIIHGEKQHYNDIKMWDYKSIPATFGAKEDEVELHDVKTDKQFVEVFEKINKNKEVMHYVELHTAVMDAPENLYEIGKAFANQNK